MIISYQYYIITYLLVLTYFVVQVNLTLNDDLALSSGQIEIISRLMRSLDYDMTLTLVKYNLLAHITSTSHIQTYIAASRSKDLTRFDVVVSALAAGAYPAVTGVCTG